MFENNTDFLFRDENTEGILDDILTQLNTMPNMPHVVNSIKHLNDICVPMVGASNTSTNKNPGTSGFVPAPTSSDANKFLRGDGTWQVVNTNTSTSASTVTAQEFTYGSNSLGLGYPIVKNTGESADKTSLKYNTSFSFGHKQIVVGNTNNVYTAFTIKADEESKDSALYFSNEANDSSAALFANFDSSGPKTTVRVKMPKVNGTLLTDSGFTVNGPVIANDTVTINHKTIMNEIIQMNGINTLTGSLRIKALDKSDSTQTSNGWDQGIRIQHSSDLGRALIGLGVDHNNINDTDGWIIMSQKYTDTDSTEHNKFSINYAGTYNNPKGSLWSDTDGEWNLTKLLYVRGENASNYLKFWAGADPDNSDTAINARITTNLNSLVIKSSGAQVKLLTKINNAYASDFYVDSLSVIPKSYTGAADNAGGIIKLMPRGNANYGALVMGNNRGTFKLFNTNAAANTVEINPTQKTMNADKYALRADSLRAIANGLYFGSNTDVKITANTSTITSSVPMTTTAVTPTGETSAYYRRIYIASTAPADTTGKNGDVWIQYKS